MSAEFFEEMKRYIGFDQDDADTLAGLKSALQPHLPSVVDDFYDNLMRDPRARSVLTSDQQVERLRDSLLVWLGELFDGRYDAEYLERRARIGRVHVRVDLPQQYMFTAMNRVRLDLARRIESLHQPRRARQLEAVHKLLDLELAIMNQTYREDLISRLQAVEKARYQAELSKSEHLAAVGELAASLAHEIKNPLAGISGAIQIFGDELPENHPHKEIIAESLRQIDRLDAAVKDLLIYARPKPPELASVAIVPLVQRTLVLLREEPAFRGLRVDCEPADADWRIKVDEHLLQQVITNLLLNAAHACKAGGAVTCRVVLVPQGIRILVKDTGLGMKPDVLVRAFEPFYTTKARGTGLGLAICKRIIEAHQGGISIESRPGRGTTVTIELPGDP